MSKHCSAHVSVPVSCCLTFLFSNTILKYECKTQPAKVVSGSDYIASFMLLYGLLMGLSFHITPLHFVPYLCAINNMLSLHMKKCSVKKQLTSSVMHYVQSTGHTRNFDCEAKATNEAEKN